MLSVTVKHFQPSVIMLNAIMGSVFMLSVFAPKLKLMGQNQAQVFNSRGECELEWNAVPKNKLTRSSISSFGWDGSP